MRRAGAGDARRLCPRTRPPREAGSLKVAVLAVAPLATTASLAAIPLGHDCLPATVPLSLACLPDPRGTGTGRVVAIPPDAVVPIPVAPSVDVALSHAP